MGKNDRAESPARVLVVDPLPVDLVKRHFGSGPLLERELDEGDVHPPIELMCGIANRADDFETEL
jgi:hypothetical protein